MDAIEFVRKEKLPKKKAGKPGKSKKSKLKHA
jgi:hypothetical protein